MFKNVYYDRKDSVINLWNEDKNGDAQFERIEWSPYVFVPTDKKTKIKTIEGQNVIKKKFKNF